LILLDSKYSEAALSRPPYLILIEFPACPLPPSTFHLNPHLKIHH